MKPAIRVPTSTYRLQLTPDFDFARAIDQLSYLQELGVDWLYLSPILASEPGSQHGYDVVAHDHIDRERGGEDGFRRLATAAHERGMGVLVDIVPNHVGVATPQHNRWWWDVLLNGRHSEHAKAFDIDWAAGNSRLRIPVVADDDLREAGGIEHLSLVEGSDGWELSYGGLRYPVAPGTADDHEAPEVDANVVHHRQHYELVSWRLADTALNYRRFFAVNTLAAIRVEDPDVFAQTHTEIGRWFEEGLVTGLRVDHPDGLLDPRGYLDRLADLTGGTYVLVEKVLERGEDLPSSWATAGTTGYDVLGLIDRVLVDPAGEEPLDALEFRLRGAPIDWEAMVHDRKREAADALLHAEVRRIVRDVQRDRALVDPARTEDAVAELIACMPVYRSYLPEGREYLDAAFETARSRRPDLKAAFDELGPLLNDEHLPGAQRLQQTSGMMMAKGVEDCAFYRWSRLTALNEVGGDPAIFAVGVEEFHAALRERQQAWPTAMTTTSTHDTKRGEDVRARITVLAEIPQSWADAVDELLRLTPMPDPGLGALLWQAALGAWPISRERLHAYAEKAMREAGDRTTWTEPDSAFEADVHGALDALYDDPAVTAVWDGLLAEVVDPGWSNALSAKLIGLTMPGVPDVYQGSELWEQSLVDPDNRRPVDFERRARVLDATVCSAPIAAPRGLDDLGAAKLMVVHRALTLRRDRPELFSGYEGLGADGVAAEHVVAFDRGGAITVATRLPVGLAARGGWQDTTLRLPGGPWRDRLTGHLVGKPRLAEILATYPVALLVREDA